MLYNSFLVYTLCGLLVRFTWILQIDDATVIKLIEHKRDLTIVNHYRQMIDWQTIDDNCVETIPDSIAED